MTRVAALLAIALATVVVADARETALPGGETARVIAVLEGPSVARSPGSGDRLDARQSAFRYALRQALPDAEVRWRYRLVLNGFAIDLPRGQVPLLQRLPGVDEVYESAQYVPQLDSTPGEIGAPGLWGPTLATAGQGMKIGIIDAGVDSAHAFFDPAGYTMPAGVPALVFVKLLLHPLLVWVLLSAIGGIPTNWIYAAIIMAALPPALNIFVISTQYKVGIERASACILVGTIVSMVTLSGFLWLVKTGRIAADLFH